MKMKHLFAGRYLIVAGPSNGGPLAQETGSETFALWKWDGNGANAPDCIIADLRPYAQRPEGVTVIVLNGQQRVIFTEDRFRATGYDTRNIVHWPVSILN